MTLKKTIVVSVIVHFLLLHFSSILFIGWLAMIAYAVYLVYLIKSTFEEPSDRIEWVMQLVLAICCPPLSLLLVYLFDRILIPQDNWIVKQVDSLIFFWK